MQFFNEHKNFLIDHLVLSKSPSSLLQIAESLHIGHSRVYAAKSFYTEKCFLIDFSHMLKNIYRVIHLKERQARSQIASSFVSRPFYRCYYSNYRLKNLLQ